MVCENIFLNDRRDIIRTVKGPPNPSSLPFSSTHAQEDQESYFFWMVSKSIADSPSLFLSDYYDNFGMPIRSIIDVAEGIHVVARAALILWLARQAV